MNRQITETKNKKPITDEYIVAMDPKEFNAVGNRHEELINELFPDAGEYTQFVLRGILMESVRKSARIETLERALTELDAKRSRQINELRFDLHQLSCHVYGIGDGDADMNFKEVA